MPRRFEKRVKRYRGNRRHGRGNIKGGRGKGNKGGWGNAGLHKHRWTWVLRYHPDYFKKKGFHSLRKKMKSINLYEIDNLISQGKVEKRDGKYFFEWRGKVIGSGHVHNPVVVLADRWSKLAEEKLKQAGGEIIPFKDDEHKKEFKKNEFKKEIDKTL